MQRKYKLAALGENQEASWRLLRTVTVCLCSHKYVIIYRFSNMDQQVLMIYCLAEPSLHHEMHKSTLDEVAFMNQHIVCRRGYTP